MDYLAPTIYFTDLIIILVIIVFGAQQWKTQSAKRKVKKLRWLPVASCQLPDCRSFVTGSWLLVAGCFLLVTSYWLFVVKQNPFLLAYNLMRLVEFSLLGLVIAKTFKKEDFPKIIKFLNWALFLQVALAGYQVLSGKSFGLWLFGERDFGIFTPGIARFVTSSGRYLLRGYGTFPHPNVLAGFCLLTLMGNSFLFLSHCHCEESDEYRRTKQSQRLPRFARNDNEQNFLFVYLLGFTLSLLGIWLSFSLLAIVLSQVFLISLAVFVFLKSPRQFFHPGNDSLARWLFFWMFPFFSFLIILFTDYYLLITIRSNSFSRRLDLLKISWSIFKGSPLFGVGLGNFIPLMPARPIGETYFWQPVHNIFALVGAETGLVGLLVIVMLLYCFFVKKKSKVKSQKLKVQIKNLKFKSLATSYQLPATSYLILITWWLVVLVTGLFDHYWLTLQQGRLMLTFLVGLSFVKSAKRVTE